MRQFGRSPVGSPPPSSRHRRHRHTIAKANAANAAVAVAVAAIAVAVAGASRFKSLREVRDEKCERGAGRLKTATPPATAVQSAVGTAVRASRSA